MLEVGDFSLYVQETRIDFFSVDGLSVRTGSASFRRESFLISPAVLSEQAHFAQKFRNFTSPEPSCSKGGQGETAIYHNPGLNFAGLKCPDQVIKVDRNGLLENQGQESAENLPGFVGKWFHKSLCKPWITLVRVSTSGPWRLDQLSIIDRELEAILSLTRASKLVLLIINSGTLALA